MGFIEHIPGTRPIPIPERHPESKGVGVLGLHEGRTLLLAMERCSSVHAVAGCDLNEEKLAASKGERPDLFFTPKYEEMLGRDDVDLVAIYTPDAHHGDHICKAFEAGKDVIVTKPIVNSLEDAARILETGRRCGRRLLVGQSSRFFEPFQRQRRDLEGGKFGGLCGIELVDAHYIHRMDWYYRKSPWATTETDWAFLGMSHPVDLVRWYLGRVAEVSAYGRTSAMGAEHGLVGRDIYVVNLTTEDGRIGRAMGHYGCHELPRARNCIELMLYASGGTSLAQYHDMRYVHSGPAGGPAVPTGFDPAEMAEVVEDYLYAGRQYYFNSEVHGMHYGEFANYAEYFGRSLIDGTDASPGLEEGVETYCVMEAVKRSAQRRKPVAIAPLLKEVGL
ncbi:MAG: Gfo/Idh/MocA family oxidoreductase [Phycisphaeraceae bacterium]|nr:MAG: Gfo/Idh/MocA family oxidoreductase [Phycisphaeraceae bacterium]